MFVPIAMGLFGFIVGSFLNVLVARHGRASLGGRSTCPSCGTTIRWYDNIPIISWILLRGRCRECTQPISLRYPTVEGLTGILFALYGGAFPFFFPYTLIALPVIAILVAIAVYDFYHTLIPDPWVYTFAGLAFVSPFFTILDDSFDVGFFLLAGPLVASPLFVLWFVSKGTWMGFGDVKLALGIGWLLGPLLGCVAIFFAFVLGAVVSVGILLPLPAIARFLKGWGIAHPVSPQSYTMKSEIPFGPFLIASTLMLWLSSMYGFDPITILL